MKLYYKRLVSFALLLAFVFCMMPIGAATATTQEARFSGYGTATETRATTSEKINFTRKEYTLTQTVNGVPKYTQVSDLENSCGATAGAMVVGFYDKYFEDLVPNYQTYVSSGAYKGRDGVYITALVRELYTLMRTNVDDVGVSQSDCLNGLKAYVNAKGHSITYNSVRYINRINETTFTNAVGNNHPVLLFCDKLDIYNLALGTNEDTVVRTSLEGGHVAVAYGAYIVNYYNGDKLFRTDKYLLIATGLGLLPSGYLKMNTTDWCNGAYEVVIA